MPDLLPSHFKHLRASGLRPTTIETIGVYSVPVPGELSPILAQCESVLAFPYPGQNGYCRYRLFPPQGSMKYFQEPGSPTHLYILPSVRSVLANPNIAIARNGGREKKHLSKSIRNTDDRHSGSMVMGQRRRRSSPGIRFHVFH